jgi:glyoxylase-like metal-dependent hydrolase (beta-lactamase superfamily II)
MMHKVMMGLAVVCASALPALAASAQDLQLLPVQGNVYMLAGAAVNVTVQVGRDGVLLVDAPPANRVAEAMALIRKISALPIRHVISTGPDAERISGDRALEPYAEPMPGDFLSNLRTGGGSKLDVLVQNNLFNRLDALAAAERPPFDGAVVTAEYGTPERDFYMNGDAVIVYHPAGAHSDSDSMVHFRHADVLSTGDVFTPGQFPRIDLARGGSVQGELAALNQILFIAIPAAYEEGGTYVVPGRGRICDEADVVEYRDMLKIVSDRIQDMLNRHMSLQQVLAAHPALDYDLEYGAAHGGPTVDQFVESVYRSLAHPDNKAQTDAMAADIASRYGVSVDVTLAGQGRNERDGGTRGARP